MKIYPFRAVAPKLDKVPHSNDFFDTVKFRYHEYAAEGLFHPTEPDAMYAYQIKMADGQKYLGLIVTTDVAEYAQGNMRAHEKTILSNEERQAELLHLRGAAIKPVLLTYPAISELDSLLENYIERHHKFYVIEFGREKHRFWQITEGLVLMKIRKIFDEQLPYAYIADGHHRSASFAALHAQSPNEHTAKMLTAYFPLHDLRINAFHRVVKDLNGLTADEFLEKLKTVFDIHVLNGAAMPKCKFELTLFLEGQWFRLHWRADVLKNFAEGLVQLDVHLLNEKVLKPILDIKNIRTDERVKYVEGIKKLSELEKTAQSPLSAEKGAVFCLYPVEFEDLKTIVDSGGTLPPKSTFFEPRLKNGLLVYEI
jgi:uncharacterized protein (DUF1015 family)